MEITDWVFNPENEFIPRNGYGDALLSGDVDYEDDGRTVKSFWLLWSYELSTDKSTWVRCVAKDVIDIKPDVHLTVDALKGIIDQSLLVFRQKFYQTMLELGYDLPEFSFYLSEAQIFPLALKISKRR